MKERMHIKLDKHTSSKMLGSTIIAFILIIVFAQRFLPLEKENVEKADIIYKGSFITVEEDGAVSDVELPVKIATPKGEERIIETLLPEKISERNYICMNSYHESIRFYIKDAKDYGNTECGDLVFCYDTTDSPFFGNNTASRFVYFPAAENMAGKVLRIVVKSNSQYSGKLSSMYFGPIDGIIGMIVSENKMTFCFAICLLVLGVVISVAGSIYSVTVYKRPVPFTYMGWTMLCSGMWIFSESRLRQFVFSNTSIIAVGAFLIPFMLAASLLLYTDAIQRYEHSNIHRKALHFLYTVMVVLIVLHFTKICDLLQTMYVSYITSYLIVFIMLFTVAYDVKKNAWSHYRYSVMGFIVLLLFALSEMAVNVIGTTNATGKHFGIGVLVMASFSSIDAMRALIKVENDKNIANAKAEAKSNFLANMSHEIRTPINGIMGMNEMILREAESTHVLEYASAIEKSSELLLSIINDILDFSKIESGQMDIIPDSFKMSEIINNLEGTLKPKAENKGLDYVVHIDSSIPENLYGDETRIKQVALNLINNAIKYTDKGRVTVTVANEGYNAETQMANLMLEVRDTGRGIKEEDKSKLFHSFQRVAEKENKNIEGSGLGLSIAYELVQLMGGTLDFDSEYGVGSVFRFRLAIKAESPEQIGDFKQRVVDSVSVRKLYSEKFHAPDAKVLVVDDNATNLTVIKLLLKKTEVTATTVGSGRDAIEKLKENEYDIVLLDHMMPEMDGVETLKLINELFPGKKFPVVALTANAIKGAKEEYLGYGFDDYLSKPVTGENLENMIIKWLPDDLIERL